MSSICIEINANDVLDSLEWELLEKTNRGYNPRANDIVNQLEELCRNYRERQTEDARRVLVATAASIVDQAREATR